MRILFFDRLTYVSLIMIVLGSKSGNIGVEKSKELFYVQVLDVLDNLPNYKVKIKYCTD